MSKRDDGALRKMAAIRGFRLVKSRIRTPGRRDHGKYGLKDVQTGKECFGFSRHRLTAGADEIEAHLRELAELGWTASLRGTRRPGRARKS